jgi:maltose alpha-D-glucosyltransferase/alpha-amylase
LRFLYPSNRKVLAYLRETEAERILCVVNVSRAPQAVELDLAEFACCIPVELTAGSLFPPISARPYLLTLPAYGFFWFRLEPVAEDANANDTQPVPELFTLVATGKLETILAGRELAAFERNVAPRFLRSRRWACDVTTPIETVRVRDFAILRDRAIGRFVLPLLDIAGPDGKACALFTPLAADVDHDETKVLAHGVAKLRRGAMTGILYDVDASPGFGPAILAALRRGDVLTTAQGGTITFVPSPQLGAEPWIDAADVHRVGSGRRHLQIVLANQLMLKAYRHVEEGPHPEIEMLQFLNEAHFAHTPSLFGVVEHHDIASRGTVLATLQSFARSQGDAWGWTLDTLKRLLESLCLAPLHEHNADQDIYASYVPRLQRLGLRTAEMHKALAIATPDPAFVTEPLTFADVQRMVEDARVAATHAFGVFQGLVESVGDDIRAEIEKLLARRQECLAVIDSLQTAPIGAVKTRIHGSFDLRQVMIVKDDVAIVGFGTAPGTFAERRAKLSPMYDVAAILCSFAYAAATARRDLAKLLPDPAQGTARLREQLVAFSQIFVSAYMEAVQDSPIFIADRATRRSLLLLCLLAKAFHTIDGDAAARPEAIEGPIEAANALLDYLAKAPSAPIASG